MNRKPRWLYYVIIAVLVIFQTTLFRFVNIKGISPDLVLIFLLFAAHFRGPLDGQLLGFFAGIMEDCLGLAPFGFNTLIRTVIGFISGNTKGKIYYDPVFMPLLGILAGGLLKQLFAFLLSWIFLKNNAGFFGVSFWLELGMTVIITPLIFNVFRLLGFFKEALRNKL